MGTLDFTGGWGIPGMGLTRETYEDAIWRENYHANAPYYGQQTISGAARDLGNTNNTTTLRAGLLMAMQEPSTVGDNQATALVPWDPTATDSTGNIWGPLLVTMNTQYLNSNDDKLVGWVLNGGLVRSASLIIPGVGSTPGLEGKDLGVLVRESMSASGRFRFDDRPNDWVGNGHKAWKTVSSDITLTLRDSGTAYVVTGGSTITLPTVTGSQGFKIVVYGGNGGGSVAEASAGDLLPSSPQALLVNERAEVVGLDNTDYLFTKT